MNNNGSIFSFFAGSGLLDLAFETNGYDVVFVNEYFPPFMGAYQYVRDRLNIPLPRDGHWGCPIDDLLVDECSTLVKFVEQEKTSGLVGFIGGPPCPDFSVAGKNKGREGERGRLSQSYVDLIYTTEPDWFLFENVKGLWRTKKHRAFYDQLKLQLSEKYDISDRLINSVEAGCPQDRDRILMFGVLKSHNTDITQVDWDKGLSFPNRSAFDNYEWPSTDQFVEDSFMGCPPDIPKELSVQYWFDTNDVAIHPNQIDCFVPRGGIGKFRSVLEGDVSRKSSKRLHRWRYSPTAAYGNNEVHLHPYKARRLTVAEALAIQSMPKEFVLPPDMTLTNKFKTIGNGVPFLLGSHVAGVIGNFLNTISFSDME